ncbi:MAG: hypothetical protein KDB14_31860 [Planctomycetales bacterium]|nr:hypothetical protein [Planctomycetales bacterium]
MQSGILHHDNFARSMGALARAALRNSTAPAKARFARSMGVLARAALRNSTAPAEALCKSRYLGN